MQGIQTASLVSTGLKFLRRNDYPLWYSAICGQKALWGYGPISCKSGRHKWLNSSNRDLFQIFQKYNYVSKDNWEDLNINVY